MDGGFGFWGSLRSDQIEWSKNVHHSGKNIQPACVYTDDEQFIFNLHVFADICLRMCSVCVGGCDFSPFSKRKINESPFVHALGRGCWR